ncbi:hypothetical protein EJ05DRAFT_309983 [Pseudovirgaria hyperparasitica]|uniref:Uncharacterized protein n=1 Tax=Pseudovirgaria hyperparasitica TaxID=470096 RepID=A0A6A6WCW4_9PEZI|nr:uncharacterized protein EJ05DRAFT_309983 [Pseudovirgaria hyperparasitica]KAF2759800.1 hypothetical protein EJ05DRAFT_309983 [Pseudovirgaria hyperparasitica]
MISLYDMIDEVAKNRSSENTHAATSDEQISKNPTERQLRPRHKQGKQASSLTHSRYHDLDSHQGQTGTCVSSASPCRRAPLSASRLVRLSARTRSWSSARLAVKGQVSGTESYQLSAKETVPSMYFRLRLDEACRAYQSWERF